MSYANETLSQLGQSGAANSELEMIAERINSVSAGMEGLLDQLRAHADRVHGGLPETAAGANGLAPCRSGLLGSIYDALANLDSKLTALAEQAGRNCTLA